MIELQNISKSFDGVSVLDNISTGIPDSGIFAICGASGSGKTTLMRIILGLEQPDSGNISGLEGKKTAVVFQNDRLLPWLSALDNVAAVCSKERAKEMLEKVELSDALNKKPAELSGGMCRRVAPRLSAPSRCATSAPEPPSLNRAIGYSSRSNSLLVSVFCRDSIRRCEAPLLSMVNLAGCPMFWATRICSAVAGYSAESTTQT